MKDPESKSECRINAPLLDTHQDGDIGVCQRMRKKEQKSCEKMNKKKVQLGEGI